MNINLFIKIKDMLRLDYLKEELWFDLNCRIQMLYYTAKIQILIKKIDNFYDFKGHSLKFSCRESLILKTRHITPKFQ